MKVPGAAQGIFSVGAFSSRSNMLWGQSAPWNNRGPNIVGRMDPDIVAVGWSATGDILSILVIMAIQQPQLGGYKPSHTNRCGSNGSG